MEELKCRAWIKNGKWKVLPIVGINFVKREIEIDFTSNNGYTSTYSFDEVEVTRYTGCSDMYGKCIFEEDILKVVDCGEDIFSRVWFEDGAFWCDFSHSNDRELLLESSMSAEIVGNIYENKEFKWLLDI